MKTSLFPLLRGISILLAFLTGMTALVFQNIWQRYITYLLGSQSQATATIIAIFLGGMSAGYFLYGHLSKIFQGRLFKLYGATEFLIGVWAFFTPQIYHFLIQFPLNHFFAEIGVTLLFLGIPTVLMGGTIPILTQALSMDLQSATRTHSLVYSFNTFGASAGSLLAGFYLLPALGLPISLIYAGTINVAVGSLFYLSNELLVTGKTPSSENETEPLETQNPNSIKLLWVIAFISGFVTIGLETITIRLMGLSAGSSVYSFSVIVAIFIFCIALGGFLVGRIKNIPPYAIWLLQLLIGFALLAVYRTVDSWPYYTHIIRTFFSFNKQTFPVYYGALTLALALALIVPISLCGATLPLCFHFAKNSSSKLGSESGKLYAINTCGCVLGALLGGYYLLYWFNLNEIFIFLIYLTVISSCIALTLPTLDRIKLSIFASLSIGLFAATANQALWDNQPFAFGLFRMQTMTSNSFKGPQAMRFKLDHLFYRDGPTASTSVLPNKHVEANTLDLSIQVNGKTDGNTFADFYTMQLLGHLPVLFSEKAENVCVIGFGTGMTAGAVTQYQEVVGIDLIEINPMVIQAGKLFAPANYNVLENNKVHVHQTDAMRFLRSTEKKHDVIISEPSNPWMAGVANLFSRDFYELAINRLTDTGVFMQWFHGYSLSIETLRLILNTFRSVFPHYLVLSLQDNDYAILGTKQAITDETLKRIQDKLAKETANPALRNLGLDKTEQFLAMEVLSEKSIDTFAEDGGLHTLENPKLDFWAGLDFFTDASINIEQLNREFAPETRLPTLLSQWGKLSGGYNEVAYPDTFCRSNSTLCNKFKNKNSLAEKLSTKSNTANTHQD